MSPSENMSRPTALSSRLDVPVVSIGEIYGNIATSFLSWHGAMSPVDTSRRSSASRGHGFVRS